MVFFTQETETVADFLGQLFDGLVSVLLFDTVAVITQIHNFLARVMSFQTQTTLLALQPARFTAQIAKLGNDHCGFSFTLHLLPRLRSCAGPGLWLSQLL